MQEFLRNPPQFRKALIGTQHFAIVVDRQYAVGCRAQYALQLTFAFAQRQFAQLAHIDLLASTQGALRTAMRIQFKFRFLPHPDDMLTDLHAMLVIKWYAVAQGSLP